MAEAGRILFHVTDDALIVANSGAPFTREGVIAICYSCVSPKSNNPPEDKEYTENDAICADARLPILLRKEMLHAPANMRKVLMGMEAQTAEDYAGRFELELLQNADDSVGGRPNSELIGAKGKGFKSVLEITDKPQISSGAFNFLLETSSGNGLRVPARSPIIKSNLFPDAVTVIRLGFRDDEAKNTAIRDLAQIHPEMLLFCQRLSQVEIHVDGESSRILEMDRNDSFGFDSGKTVFTLRENGVDQKWIRWSAAWDSKSACPGESGRRLSAALCLPANKDGKAVALENERPIHVFFPTSEELPGLMALMHASYRLGSNRKHLLEMEKQHDGPAIREKFRGLITEILHDISPSVSLRTFGTISHPDEASSKTELDLLRGVFFNVVADTPFVPVIGGDKVKPAESRLWKHNLGCVLRQDLDQIRSACLLAPVLNFDHEARDILKTKLGAKNIGGPLEHAKFLAHCENDDNEKCVEAFRVANSIMRERGQGDNVAEFLKKAPFWRTDNLNHPARALAGDILLWHRPADWPEWLWADALLPEFTDEICDEDFANLKEAMGTAWPLDKSRYFQDALIRFCRDKPREWWEEMGESALEQVLKWGGEIVGKSEEGLEFGRIIHLPTNNGWLPATQCYFGKAWDGRGCFDQLEKTGVVKPPNEWRTGNAPEWRQMLNWLGVSWTPKLCRRGNEYYFDPLALEALMQKAKPQELLTDICEMTKKVHGTNAADALRQLQNVELIPCRPGIFDPNVKRVKPGDAYMPGCGIKGYFPEVKIRGDLSQTMQEWLPRLGVLTDLPPSEDKSKWREYMRNLAVESQHRGENSEDLQWKKGELAEVIRALYDKYGASLSGMGDVPYLRQVSDGSMFVNFAPATEIRWMDKNYHKAPAVYRDIFGEFKIFPFELEHGRRFGLPPLSGNMEWLCRLVEKCPRDRLRWDKGKEGNVAKFIRDLYRGNGKYGDLPKDMAYAPFLRRDKNGIFVRFAEARSVRWADKPHYEDPKVRRKLLTLDEFKIFPWFLNLGQDFHLSPLSNDIREECTPGPYDGIMTKALRRRFEKREKGLGAFIRHVCNVPVKPLSKSNILAYASLKLVLMNSREEKIAEISVDAYLQDECICVNGGNDQWKWRALADGLAQWWEKSQYRNDFEILLEKEDWIHRLRDWGISDEDLAPLEAPLKEEPPEPLSDSDFPSVQRPRGAAPSALNSSDRVATTVERPPTISASSNASRNNSTARSGTGTSVTLPPEHKGATAGPTVRSQRTRGRTRPSSTKKHTQLQNQILQHPENIGLSGAEGSLEYKFQSEDKVDLLFTTKSEYVAVEVKPQGCSDEEIERGAYQCVKYDALLKATIKLNQWPLQEGRTIFALGGVFPPEMKSIRKFLDDMDIKIYESLSD